MGKGSRVSDTEPTATLWPCSGCPSLLPTWAPCCQAPRSGLIHCATRSTGRTPSPPSQCSRDGGWRGLETLQLAWGPLTAEHLLASPSTGASREVTRSQQELNSNTWIPQCDLVREGSALSDPGKRMKSEDKVVGSILKFCWPPHSLLRFCFSASFWLFYRPT